MLNLGNVIGDGSKLEMAPKERRQGTYIIGTTGTGKSTLLRNMIFQDMKPNPNPDLNQGLCLLDPHGDLIDEVLEMVPNDRVKDVILFDPTDTERPFGLNLLASDRDNPTEVRWVISTVISTLRRLYHYSWGPRLQHVLSNALETIMKFKGSTFIELYFLLSNKEYRRQIISDLDDPVLEQFWESFPSRSERLEYELTASTLNKISPFVTDKMMRYIIGQSKNTIDLVKIMKEGKILLVNLSKGDLGEENSSLLGAVLVNLVLIAALKRREEKYDDRKPFHLYVDEFQNFASESFSMLQSEARKYAVDIIVAHQFRDQLDDLIKGSTLNVGNLIIFRSTGRDGFELASQFDNTPPSPEIVMEPEYKLYKETEDGKKLYTQPKSTTGVGSLYQPVERIRRTYSDMQGEMANRLSILPNYQAWCRLIYDPESRQIENEDPYLIQRHIKTEVIKTSRKREKQEEMRNRIKKNSRRLAEPLSKVKREIDARMIGDIKEMGQIQTYQTRKTESKQRG